MQLQSIQNLPLFFSLRAVCETPGPANYTQICRKVWQAPPEFSCREQCRPGFPAILNYPEYGTLYLKNSEISYHITYNMTNNCLQFFLGLMKNEVVGPDSYDPDKGFDQNNSPSYSIGNRCRSARSKC
jgi:hypothetical protein